MKLRLISEIQRKFPSTNMNRSNVTGALAVGSINDYMHLVHGEKTESADKSEDKNN